MTLLTQNTDWLKIAVQLGGLAHFCILIASAMVPKALNWRRHFESLPKLLHQMFWVYVIFIVLMIIGLGISALVHAEAMIQGDQQAKWIAGMICVFWAVRLFVQLFVYDAKPFLTIPLYKFGYHILTVVFIYLTLIFGGVAFL